MSYVAYGAGDKTDVRSPTRTSTEVRSPTSTSTEVRSPTSTSTEVRSPTSTSTDAYTAGNVTVTGGAGAGATTSVTIYHDPHGGEQDAEHAHWVRNRLPAVLRATPDGYAAQDRGPATKLRRATDLDHPDVSVSRVPRATDHPDLSPPTDHAMDGFGEDPAAAASPSIWPWILGLAAVGGLVWAYRR